MKLACRSMRRLRPSNRSFLLEFSPCGWGTEPPTSVLTRLFSSQLQSGEANGTRRPALLGTDVRRLHTVAVDCAIVQCHFHCSSPVAAKIGFYRCYNLI